MRDIQKVLEHWGSWAASDNTKIDYSTVAAGFKGLIPHISRNRPSCTDEDGLRIDGCMARLKKKKPYEYSLLVAHYIFRISKRKMAKVRKKDEKLIRIEIQIAEGFIDGCLAMLDIRLDMDPEE